MALPGLVRVSVVARILGVSRVTARAHLMSAGCSPIRRPRLSATSGDGPWYVTIEDAVRLVDWLLPRVVHRRANARARERLRDAERLTGSSGEFVRYREGGTGSGSATAITDPASPPTKIPIPAVSGTMPSDAQDDWGH